MAGQPVKSNTNFKNVTALRRLSTASDRSSTIPELLGRYRKGCFPKAAPMPMTSISSVGAGCLRSEVWPSLAVLVPQSAKVMSHVVLSDISSGLSGESAAMIVPSSSANPVSSLLSICSLFCGRSHSPLGSGRFCPFARSLHLAGFQAFILDLVFCRLFVCNKVIYAVRSNWPQECV